MYNFLDYKLIPNVCVNCPETDGYEVNNLVSDKEYIKSKGFIAYSAIRPPINVDFVFICPVKINYISIWTSAGSQKSTGIEFQAKNSNHEFTTICKAFTDAPGIVIYNKNLREKRIMPEDFSVRHCKSVHYNLLSSVEKLRVRILRTENSVPCIGRIEVWGEVSRVCTETTKQTIQKLISPKFENHVEPIKIETVCSKKIELLNIPEDFIDPISCELMCLPMTLPSGKTVDQSTLEKHQKSEAVWNRSPSDPFTGQTFTSLRKPVLNSALKSRIDAFLLENADNKLTFNVKRTLGRKSVENNQISEENINSHFTNNLDDIINNSFKKYNLTRYTESSTKINNEFCEMCQIDNNLYVLSCKHFLCKNCLVKSAEIKCKTCDIVVERKNVEKHHS